MNKNLKTYLLLITVIGIWGLIAYRIFSAINQDPTKQTLNDISVKFNPKAPKSIDTFSIATTLRDPFLGTLSAQTKQRSKQKGNVKPSKEIKNRPRITYGGMIKKQQSNQQVFVLNINNNQYLLKKGQTADSVKLIQGNTKEVIVRYHNKTFSIPIQ